MRGSASRILTTHAGSLPRPAALVDLQLRTSRGEQVDPGVLAEAAGEATRRVLAGTDCGFDTSTGCGCVADEVVWENLRSLRLGADLASARLY